jgi:hypothetical protein
VCFRCPIIGDRKHGSLEPSAAVAEAFSRLGLGLLGSNENADGNLFLHARSTVVKYARGTPSLAVTAPLPKHMARVWDALGWDHAVVNYGRPEETAKNPQYK